MAEGVNSFVAGSNTLRKWSFSGPWWIVRVDSSIILFRPFRAQENLMVHDPGALPLAIRFHAFSVKRKPLLTAHCSLLTAHCSPLTAHCSLLSSTSHFACLCINPHYFAFFNKQRHTHGQARLEGRLLTRAAGRCVAAQTQLGRRDGEFHVLRELQ